jgi:hypothetical protein
VRGAASLEARAVSEFLAANAPTIGELFPLDELERDATDLASKYKNRVEVGEGPWLASLVVALVWADELASDGYRDPRLPE